MRATSADRGLLAMKDGEGFITRAERVREGNDIVDGAVRVSRTFVRRVLDEKQALLAKDATRDASLVGAKSVMAIGIQSVVCVPLLDAKEEVTGFLYLDKVSGGSPERRDDPRRGAERFRVCPRGRAQAEEPRAAGARILGRRSEVSVSDAR